MSGKINLIGVFLVMVVALAMPIYAQSNLLLGISQKTIETCPCTAGVFNATLYNPGNFSETYIISTERYFTASVKNMTLAPKKSASFFVYGMFECDKTGNFSSKMVVKTLRTGLIASPILSIKVKPCYNYSLQLGKPYINYVMPTIKRNGTFLNITYPKLSQQEFILEENESYEFCTQEHRIIPLKVTNEALIANNYYLTIDGPKWVSLDYPAFSLKGGQASLLAFHIMAPKEEGIAKIGLKSVTERGKVLQELNFTIGVRNCYTPEITINSIETNFSKQDHFITINNTGKEKATYLLNFSGPSWIFLSQSVLNIQPQESEEILLSTYPSNDSKKGKYKAELLLTSLNNNISYPQTITVKLTGPNPIVVLVQGWYAVFRELFLSYQGYFYGILIGIAFALILFIIFFIKPFFKGRYEPKKEIEKKTVQKTSKKKSEKRVMKKKTFLWIIYSLLIFVLLISASMYFATRKPEPAIEDITLENVTVEPVVMQGQIAFFSDILSYPVIWYVIAALSMVLILFIFRKSKRIWIVVAYIIVIVALLLGIFFAAQYVLNNPLNLSIITSAQFKISEQEINQSQPISFYPPIEMDEDTTLDVDLQEYFSDPEGNLAFSSSVPENVDVNIIEGIATLSPHRNWYGKEYVEFKAVDSSGIEIKTGNIAIIVKDMPEDVFKDKITSTGVYAKKVESSLFTFLFGYLKYIIIGIVILVLIILIIHFNKQILHMFSEK